MEGIIHFPLIQSDDLYRIMKDLLEKKIQQNLEIKKFKFKVDNQRFPKAVQLQSFQSNGLQRNLYLNRYLNYVPKTQTNSDTLVDKCSTIDMNKNCSIIVAGCSNKIKVFSFQSDELKETQVLSEHKAKVVTLNFMKWSDQFISGGKDKQIIVWSMNPSRQWVCQQKLIEHADKIKCLVLNNKDDLIITGSDDKTIRFWTKKDRWQCQQSIQDHTGSILGLSINQKENQVISCGLDGLILIIEYSSSNSEWIIVQKIAQANGAGICFIDNDIFTVQLTFGIQMHIYKKDTTNSQYKKVDQFEAHYDQNLIIGQMLYGYHPFSQLYIQQKGVLAYKIGNKLLFIRQIKQGDFKIEKSIEFGSFKFVGRLSEDGQHLVTWEKGTENIYISKYNKI